MDGRGARVAAPCPERRRDGRGRRVPRAGAVAVPRPARPQHCAGVVPGELLLRRHVAHVVRRDALPLGPDDHRVQAARQLVDVRGRVLSVRQDDDPRGRRSLRRYDRGRRDGRQARPRLLGRGLRVAAGELRRDVSLRAVPQARHRDGAAHAIRHALLQQRPLAPAVGRRRPRQRRGQHATTLAPRRRPRRRHPRRHRLDGAPQRRPLHRLHLVRLGHLGHHLLRRRRPQQDPRERPRLPPLRRPHLAECARLHRGLPLRRLHLQLREAPRAPLTLLLLSRSYDSYILWRRAHPRGTAPTQSPRRRVCRLW
mmetsp:Transcript_4282/g.17374  ORF Transcript_4282/g.17374 Transcript_4282/m.17374 type:complete len:311 (-) Transcript_4282:109-1041(-)